MIERSSHKYRVARKSRTKDLRECSGNNEKNGIKHSFLFFPFLSMILTFRFGSNQSLFSVLICLLFVLNFLVRDLRPTLYSKNY